MRDILGHLEVNKYEANSLFSSTAALESENWDRTLGGVNHFQKYSSKMREIWDHLNVNKQK